MSRAAPVCRVWQLLARDLGEGDLGLTFSFSEVRGGEHVDVELKAGGSCLPVCESNKTEFVELLVDHRLRSEWHPPPLPLPLHRLITTCSCSEGRQRGSADSGSQGGCGGNGGPLVAAPF